MAVLPEYETVPLIAVVPTTVNEVEVIETIPEVVNDVSSELQRRLDRLKYDIRNMYDAETRYRLECEYYELGGTREFLNK